MTATSLPSSRVPREWLAAITSPTRGVMDAGPAAWQHSPATIERVLVREVIPGTPSLAPAGEPGQSVDVAAAIEAAFAELAHELGCARLDLVPGNSGLFVPGTKRAQPTARHAIKELFEHVRAGGLVNRPIPPETLRALGLAKAPSEPAAAVTEEAPKPKRTPKAEDEAAADPRQTDLF